MPSILKKIGSVIMVAIVFAVALPFSQVSAETSQSPEFKDWDLLKCPDSPAVYTFHFNLDQAGKTIGSFVSLYADEQAFRDYNGGKSIGLYAHTIITLPCDELKQIKLAGIANSMSVQNWQDSFTHLVKFADSPKVYLASDRLSRAEDKRIVLNHIPNESMAKQLYGESWSQYVITLDGWTRDYVNQEAELSLAHVLFPYNSNPILVKTAESHKIYVVIENSKTIRWIPNEKYAVKTFGPDWAKHIKVISDQQLKSYMVGLPIGYSQ